MKVNSIQKTMLGKKIRKHYKNELAGKTFAVWGLAFKPNTDDMRESASLVIIPALVKAGANLKLFDPEGMEQAKTYLGTHKNILWCETVEDALEKADAAAILTEWQMFSTIDWRLIKKKMKQPVVIDMRNLFAPLQMAKQGITYHSIGRSVS
jgi:UDPglucose 6-dehydrogenase